MTPIRIACLLLLTLALAAAGCGGSSSDSADDGAAATTETSPSTDGGTGGDAEEIDTSSPAYQGGFQLCSQGTPQEVAALYGVDPPTKEAVAEAIAEQVGGGGSEQDRAEGRQACLDAFAAQK